MQRDPHHVLLRFGSRGERFLHSSGWRATEATLARSTITVTVAERSLPPLHRSTAQEVMIQWSATTTHGH